MPKLLTHEACLEDTGDALKRFLGEIDGLGDKLGCVLVQLSPGLAYDPRIVESFFGALRARHRGPVVCEPRHYTWFTGAADAARRARRRSRCGRSVRPGGGGDEPSASPRVAYFRLHGSPVMYHSSYSDDYLAQLSMRIRAIGERAPVWCVLDNTARGAAAVNALDLLDRLTCPPSRTRSSPPSRSLTRAF